MNMATNLSSNTDGTLCQSVAVEIIAIGSCPLYLLFTPLLLCVLREGYRRKKTRQSPPSHSDVFTFHIIAMEIIVMMAVFSTMFAAKTKDYIALVVASDLYNIGVASQMCIHTLTCVERYLAVVHPVTYLRLKQRGGVHVRNISIVGAWLLGIGSRSLRFVLTRTTVAQLLFCLTFLPLALVSFCSASVLFVLIRPKPGEGEVGRADRSKRKAFITIVIIMGVLLLRFVYYIVPFVLIFFPVQSKILCLVSYLTLFLNFPSSLVLPLMFLQKAKKLPKCFVIN